MTATTPSHQPEASSVSTTTAKPEVEGLFTWPATDVQLIAARCPSCENAFFPAFAEMHRPGCPGATPQQILLSPTGTVVSYTVQRYAPPEPFPPADDYEPMVIVTVSFAEGLQVPGALIGVPPDEVRVGLHVRTVADVLYRSDGLDHLTWRFALAHEPRRDDEVVP
jgi:uncharacterized protein